MSHHKAWGAYSPLVLFLTITGLVIDQAAKIWVVHIYDMANNLPIRLLPVLDIILVWNPGISYGLLQQNTELGRWGLAIFTLVASVFIWFWSVKSHNRLVAFCLGLVLAGALANGIDRLVYGKVVDYIYFHIGSFSWYVFNLADVWIVIGAIGLIYDSVFQKNNSGD